MAAPLLANLPPGCLLDRRVRTDFDDEDEHDLMAQQPFKILRCVERKACGFSSEMQPYANQVVQSLHLGVHLADSPPDLSCLALKGGSPVTRIEAVDEGGVIVLTTTFLHDFSSIVYLVYDAVTGLLHMAPAPENPSWIFTGLTVRLVVARPTSCGGDDYALVLLGKLEGQGDAALVWRPGSSTTLPPWSMVEVSFPSCIGSSSSYQVDATFSLNGMGCWADLLRGGVYCHWDTLFSNDGGKQPSLKFDFFPLPNELATTMSKDHCRSNIRVAQPQAYRAVGVVNRTAWFVSMDGFLEHVKHRNHTVSVWRLCQEDMDWKLVHKLSLEGLWGLEGFGNLPRDLTPMYPVLSPHDDEVVYFSLGKCREIKRNWLCIPTCAQYLLALNIRKDIIQAKVSLAEYFDEPDIPDIVSSSFCRYISVVDLDVHILMMEMEKQLSVEAGAEEPHGRALLPANYYLHPRLAQSGIVDTILEHHSGDIVE